MNMKILVLALAAGLGGLTAGCVHTANDRTQFGIPFLPDDAEANYKQPVPQVVQAARDVIKEHGTLEEDNSVNNSMKGRVNDANVYVRVDDKDGQSHLVVQCRTKGGAADSNLAHDIDKQIALKLGN